LRPNALQLAVIKIVSPTPWRLHAQKPAPRSRAIALPPRRDDDKPGPQSLISAYLMDARSFSEARPNDKSGIRKIPPRLRGRCRRIRRRRGRTTFQSERHSNLRQARSKIIAHTHRRGLPRHLPRDGGGKASMRAPDDSYLMTPVLVEKFSGAGIAAGLQSLRRVSRRISRPWRGPIEQLARRSGSHERRSPCRSALALPDRGRPQGCTLPVFTPATPVGAVGKSRRRWKNERSPISCRPRGRRSATSIGCRNWRRRWRLALCGHAAAA